MPRRERTPLHDVHGSPSARFATTPWDDEGKAALEASGGDVRSALEAGLRAVLKLSADSRPEAAASDRSAPLQGEGDDLAELFLDLFEDFLDQMAFSPFACHDVVMDGVLHREGGGYVAWGYATESTAPVPETLLPFVHQMPTVESAVDEIIFRATFAREEE